VKCLSSPQNPPPSLTATQLPTAGVDTQRRIHIQRQQQWRGPANETLTSAFSHPLGTESLFRPVGSSLCCSPLGAPDVPTRPVHTCVVVVYRASLGLLPLSLSLSLLGHTTGSLILPRVSCFACHTRQCPAGGRIDSGRRLALTSECKRTVLRVICVWRPLTREVWREFGGQCLRCVVFGSRVVSWPRLRFVEPLHVSCPRLRFAKVTRNTIMSSFSWAPPRADAFRQRAQAPDEPTRSFGAACALCVGARPPRRLQSKGCSERPSTSAI
jgi:hypothetical protein